MLQAVSGVAVLSVLAWVGISTASEERPDPGRLAAPVQQFKEGDRSPVELFVAETLQGKRFASEDLLGRVVVYNVWGSWCVPCRAEIPELIKVADSNPGVQFVGINVREPEAAARAFERRFGVPYPSIRSDDSGTALLAFGSQLTAGAVPATVVVDREGRVAARVLGRTTATTLGALVEQVLAER